MTVIALTRALATTDRDVARMAAERLGLRLLDRDLVEDLAESLDQPTSAVARLVEGCATPFDRMLVDRRRLALSVARVVYTHALAGGVLVRGWAAPALLSGVPGVLSVRLDAPLDWRVSRQVERLGRADHTTLAREIRASDERESVTTAEVTGESGAPGTSAFDVALDASRLSPALCADHIVRRALTLAGHAPARRRAVADRLLAVRARLALVQCPGTAHLQLKVTATQGLVTLEGVADDETDIALAGRVVATVTAALENRIKRLGRGTHREVRSGGDRLQSQPEA